jgi:hypothetical protein
MADIIPLRRNLVPARAVSPDRVTPDPLEVWMLPWAMFRAGLAAWANLWFAPLGLKVEPARDDGHRD